MCGSEWQGSGVGLVGIGERLHAGDVEGVNDGNRTGSEKHSINGDSNDV